MVPSGKVVVDIGIVPLISVEVITNGVSELRLRVPSTVDVEHAANREHGVTTTALRGVVCGLDLLPFLGFEIIAVEIVKSDSLVIDTTMTTEQVDLSIKEGGTSVSTRCWGSVNGVLVLGSCGGFAISALPG